MRNKRSGHVPCKHIHALQMLFGCHYPPRRHDDVKDLLADQASVLFDDVPAAPATDDAVLPPSTTESCTDNLDVLSVEDVDLPSSCEENLDGASSKIRSSISSSISLLQQRLQVCFLLFKSIKKTCFYDGWDDLYTSLKITLMYKKRFSCLDSNQSLLR